LKACWSAWNHEAGYGPSGRVAAVTRCSWAWRPSPTDGEAPRPDEPLSFEIVTGRDGRKQAVNLCRPPRATTNAAHREAVGAGSARVRQAQKTAPGPDGRRRRRDGHAGGRWHALVAAGGQGAVDTPALPALIRPALANRLRGCPASVFVLEDELDFVRALFARLELPPISAAFTARSKTRLGSASRISTSLTLPSASMTSLALTTPVEMPFLEASAETRAAPS
jgi:hypothetical protein